MWSSQQACEMSILDPETESQRGNTVWICFTPAFFEYLEYCVPSTRLIILHASEDSQPNQEEARLGLGLLPVPLISPWAALSIFRKLLSAWVLNKWLWSFLLQIVRTDLKELRDFNLDGAPYGYTPFCDSRREMDGYRFWKSGYWASHLAGRKYHIRYWECYGLIFISLKLISHI